MEYLIALLTALAVQLPSLNGHPVPGVESMPALEVADNLGQAVFAYTGQESGGDLGIALYLPRENVIIVNSALLDDLPELQAVLVHELIHWWQVWSRRADSRGGANWEEEARTYENLWRRKHGLPLRPTRILPTRTRQ